MSTQEHPATLPLQDVAITDYHPMVDSTSHVGLLCSDYSAFGTLGPSRVFTIGHANNRGITVTPPWAGVVNVTAFCIHQIPIKTVAVYHLA